MKRPKISVIVPSFNQGRFLGEALDSIFSQEYDNLEVLVIDGGSSDNSIDVIRSYEARISWWTSQADRGQSHAINKGFERASGDILAWLNSDDLYMKGTFQTVINQMVKARHIDCIHAPAEIFDSSGKIAVQGMDAICGFASYLSGMPSPQPSFFFKRSMLDAVGMLDESLHHGLDYDFFLRIALTGEMRYIEGQPLSRYRIHDASKSNNDKLAFAREWASVFSTLLKSAPFDRGIQEFEDFGLFTPLDRNYDCSRLDLNILPNATGLALLNIATFLNLGGERKKALKIIAHLGKHHKEVYRLRALRKAHVKLQIQQFLTGS